MIWCISTVICWVSLCVVFVINIHNYKKAKENIKKFKELQEKHNSMSMSYAAEAEARWRCEEELINLKLNNEKKLSILRDESERLRLKYEHQLNKNIELMEKIILVDENERGQTE